MTSPAPARVRAPDDPVRDVQLRGFHEIADGVCPDAAGRLLRRILATRRFDETLFLSEAEFDADPQYKGVNPGPGRNLLEAFDPELAFVEADVGVTGALGALLGDGYEVILKKLICGVPARSLPEWVLERIQGNPVNNLGAYVRPEFRDVTYFYGIDFHQDLIDYPEREADFVTLYVYLHDVTAHDAPLFLLEGSHALGGSLFPHDLARAHGSWRYRDGRGGEVMVRQHRLTGSAGYAALWHACTLHGTQPDAADNARLSLRYLVAKTPGAGPAGVDAVNRTLAGPLSLEETRRDLDRRGAAVLKVNAVNTA